MNETLVTVVGNVATQPEVRKSASGAISARFRLATTERRWDRERAAWTDGHTSFYTVWAWRQLGENVAGSVSVGEPLMVSGRLRVREERGQDGQRWTSADIDAVAVGHDMARGTSAFRRTAGARPELTVPLSLATQGPDGGPGGSGAGRAGAGTGSGTAEGSGSGPGDGLGSSPGSESGSAGFPDAAAELIPVGATPPF